MATSEKPYKVGLVQMRMSDDLDANLRDAVDRCREAADRGAELVCLPELFRTPYLAQREDPRLFDWAEPVPGPSTAALAEVARDAGVTILAPLFERRSAGLYHNSSAVIGPDGHILDLYRKMHIPDDPGFYEKFYFAPGDRGFRTCRTPVGPVGTLICWDQWYPEAARLTALKGAHLLAYPTAIGWHPSEKAAVGRDQLAAWQTVQRGHAIANGVYLAAVNRVGLETALSLADGIEFWGHTFLCDPFGVIVAEAAEDREETLVAEINPTRVEQIRRAWPFLRDRRTEEYAPIRNRWLADEVTGEF